MPDTSNSEGLHIQHHHKITDSTVESKHASTWTQRAIQRWQQLSAIPDEPEDNSFYKRDTVRKSRLISTVLFYLTIVMIVFLPCSELLPNPNITYVDGVMLIALFIAIYLNRKGKMIASALIASIGFQLVLTAALIMLSPLDGPSIQLYDLYIMGLLLAVSLLPPRNVFLFAIANSILILLSLTIQPHTATLNHDLQAQFIPMMIRPIALQFMTAGISYVWVRNTTLAITRADRAEMVAALEHELTTQARELEEGIEQILQTHVAFANGNLNARAPLNQENALWQIARALNTLLVRLQRTVQAEREMQRVEQAVYHTVQIVHEAEKRQQVPRIAFTQTIVDPLIAVLQGKMPASSINTSNTHQLGLQAGQAMPPAFQMPNTPRSPEIDPGLRQRQNRSY